MTRDSGTNFSWQLNTPCGPRDLKIKPGEAHNGGRLCQKAKFPISRRHSFDSAIPHKRRFSDGDNDLIIEDISHKSLRYCDDMQVIFPYQYEDAEEEIIENPSLRQKEPSQKSFGNDDVLIDWMGSLRCDSEKESSCPKNGRKRKSRASLSSQHRRSFSQRSANQGADYKESLKNGPASKKSRKDSHDIGADKCSSIDSTPVRILMNGPVVSSMSDSEFDQWSSTPCTTDSMEID